MTDVTDGADTDVVVDDPANTETPAVEDVKPDGAESVEDGDSKTPESDSDSQDDSDVEYSDFEMPEGLEMDEQMLSEVSPLFKDAKLTQDQAQKFVDALAKKVQGDGQQRIEEHQQRVNEWAKEAEADKEIGGEKFKENASIAKSALEKFFEPDVMDLLEETGFGSHPAFIRGFYKIGLMLVEDNPGGNTETPRDKKSVAQRLYPEAQS